MLRTREASGIVNEYLKLASEYKLPVDVSDISDEECLFRLVVIGEIKSGKSSLINTLVGEESPQLPVGVPVTTSTAFVISDGQPRSNRVYFNEPNNRPPMIISDDEVEQYGTESLNSENEKGVGEIAITLPNDFLRDNKSIVVDTPGLGGVFKKHRAITWKYGPTADALCYVFRSQQLTQSEIEDAKQFWETPNRIGMSKPPIFFVQTMIDRCEPEELTRFQKENRNLISKHLGIPESDLNYFLVNSNYRKMAEENPDYSEWLKAESGYPELEDFFQQFQQRVVKQKEEHLFRELLHEVGRAIKENLQPYIQELREIYKASTEELSGLENRLKKINEDLTEWKEQTFPKIEQDFRRRINNYLSEAKNDLNSELAHGYRGSKTSPISNSIIEEYLNLPSVESIADLRKPEHISKMQEKCVQVCEDRFFSIINKTQKRAVNAVDEACKGLEKSIEDVLESSNDADGKRGFSNANIKIGRLSPKPSGFKVISDTLRETSPVFIAVGFVTAILGAAAVMGTGGAATPIAAKGVALSWQVAAGLIGGPLAFGWVTRRERNAEAIRQEVRSNLDDIVRQIYDRAVSRFSDFADEIRKATKNNLDNYSQCNIQKLTDLWFEVDGQRKSREAQMDSALSDVGVEDGGEKKVEADAKKAKQLLDRINRVLDT